MTKSPTAVICLSPYQGGMEIDSLKLSQMLSDISNVTLIAKKDHFIAREYKNNDNSAFTLEEISFKKSLSPSIVFGVRKIIKMRGIKNVLFLGASELKSLYLSFMGLDINLIIRHGTTKSTPKKDWFHRLIYSNVNTHVAICEHLANNVKKIIPFGAATQLKVIYPSLNIIPSRSIDYSAKPHKPLRLLHVGRIAAGKGQIAAIKACNALYEAGIAFTFDIVGGFHSSYQKEFEEFLQTLPYRDAINLVGHSDNVESYYLNSDIFCFPSDGEGLSNAFIEALSYGLSAISYDNTAFPELQHLGLDFSLVKDQDVEALSTQLLTLARHYPLAEKAQHNSTFVQSFFTVENERRNLGALLVEAL